MEKIEPAMKGDLPFANTFASERLLLERGEGVWIYDIAGNRYLDMGSGIAVNSLGYGHEDLAKAVYHQMQNLVHVSNYYTTQSTIDIGEKLLTLGDFDGVFLGNSGSEANETALKFARLYSYKTKGPGNHKFLSFHGSFHGRTMGALSCTPNQKYQEPFMPLLDGTEYLPFNDVKALEDTLDGTFAAVIVEPLQGEGGLNVMTKEFARALNRVCEKHDVLIIADEIQSGLSRTGAMLTSTLVGLKPDIVTLAKPIAGGLPMSATLVPQKVNSLLYPGVHGTTFGSNPVAAAAANIIWDALSAPGFQDAVNKKAVYLKEKLEELKQRFPQIIRVKGLGLLLGLEIKADDGDDTALTVKIKSAAEKLGVLPLLAGKNILRLAPPLIITNEELDYGIEKLTAALEQCL